jgi:hypothetical protein
VGGHSSPSRGWGRHTSSCERVCNQVTRLRPVHHCRPCDMAQARHEPAPSGV